MNLTEKLIDQIKLHKVLYDPSHPEYKNIKTKNKIWNEIGTLLCTDSAYVKKRWKNLRDSYAKHIRTEALPLGSSERKHIDRYRTWPWAKQMGFYKPFSRTSASATQNEVSSESQDQQLSNVFYEDSAHTPDTNASAVAPKNDLPAKKRKRSSRQSAIDKVIEYLQNRPAGAAAVEYDDVDLICLGYSKTMKQFSQRRQTLTKFRIAQVLMEEELNQQVEDITNISNAPSTSTQSYQIMNSPISEVSHTVVCKDRVDDTTCQM